MLKANVAAVVVLVWAVALAGCGTDQGAKSSDPSSAGTPTRSTVVRSARCLDVDDSFLRLIISPESTGPIPLSDGQAVNVHGFEDGYFVSAYFHDDDGVWPDRTGVGIWWADRLDAEAMIWAVNERAGISDWADASTARGAGRTEVVDLFGRRRGIV